MDSVDLWVCCQCGGANMIELTSEYCPVCNHEVCHACEGLGGSYGAGYATTGQESDAEREVYNDTSVSPNHLRDVDSEREEADIGPLLDPGSHFYSLEALEVEVVKICLISRYSYSDGIVNARIDRERYTIDDCIEDLCRVDQAFHLLQKNGFCGSQFNILLQDPTRHEVAVARPVSGALLEKLLKEAKSIKSSIAITDESHLDDLGSPHSIKGEEQCLSSEELLQNLQIVPAGRSSTRPGRYNAERVAQWSQFLIPVLMLGLVSYSGSHVNRFDLIAYSKPVIAFHLTGDFTFRQRRLACLGEFIDGPAWILERFPTDCENYWISISTDDFADLWGPLSLAEENDGSGSVKCIYTERGVITHVGDLSGLHLAKPNELRCHWQRLDSQQPPLTSRHAPEVELSETPSSAQVNAIDVEDIPSSVILVQNNRNTSGQPVRLLIGGSSQRASNAFGWNQSCQADTEVINSRGTTTLQFPGVSKPQMQLDQVATSLSAGQWLKGGVQTTWKRIPGRSHKDGILLWCKRKGDITPIWGLRLGVEISLCTGNARRVTLWEAVKLLHAQREAQERDLDHDTKCLHEPGDPDCLLRCWNLDQSLLDEVNSMPPGDEADIKRKRNLKRLCKSVMIAGITDLSITGYKNDGYLQVWWPFTQVPYIHRIKSKSEDGTHHGWLQMLKDTTYISAFAVMSKRCFTYEGDDLVASERVFRLCKGTRRRSTQSKSIRQSHTVLETVIQLHPDSVACLDLDNSLQLGSYLRIGEIGSLHIRNNGEAQLAVFKSGMMATISELAICASRASWGHTHYELIDDEIATRKTARAIVI